jgi:hypothetical protein
MSHVQHIGGSLNTSAEYQEYLARLGAGRRARRSGETAATGGLRTFDSAIDTERDCGEDGGGPGDDPKGEPSQPGADRAPDGGDPAANDGDDGGDGHELSARV